jgi:catechol 2,3-dioxygenase-like lactoylglutathione lyase family enzyme
MTRPGPTAPITGFSHVQLLVSDVAASEHWYSKVLGMERLVASDDNSYVALRHRPSRVVIVLTPKAGDGDGGTPLDHLAFAVADGPTLERWAAQLTEWGIAHPGVVLEQGKPSLVLADPDGIQIELVAPPARD